MQLLRLFLLLGITVGLISALPAIACRGVDSETTTFLDRLPANAMSKPIVAKVEVVSSKTEKNRIKLGGKTVENDSKIIAETKVIEPLKGVPKGAAIKVEVVLTSCSREPRVAIGKSFYLAGVIDEAGIFHGEWKRSEVFTK